jgi:hypothetical protein
MVYASVSRVFIVRVVCLLCLPILFVLTLHAQSTKGSIFGTITDASNAVVPEATITVTSVEQGTVHTTITSTDGSYRVTQLEPGTYRVSVERSGFTKVQSEVIPLAIEANVRADLSLKAGSTAVTVDVTAANALLETGSAEVSGQVTREELHNFPTIDRNIVGLMSLSAGTTPGNSTGRVGLITGAEVVAMGTPPVGNSFLIDGVTSNMEFSGTVAAKPPMDTVAGFSTQIAQFPADEGRAAGAVLNMSLKSGTNRLHGSVYEYIQNNIANAAPYNFQTIAQPVLPYHRNQYGANLGGPIIRNKAFFFVGWEGLKQLQSLRTQYTVPTAAEKRGDFTGLYTVYDPASLPVGSASGTRTAFPNNIIPASRISPIGAAFLKFYPDPNYGTTGYLQIIPKTLDSNSWVGKVNMTLTPSDSVDVHYLQQNQAIGGSNLNYAVTATTTAQDGINTGINYIHIFSPTLLNTLRLSYSRFYLPSIANNQTDFMSQISIPGWPNDAGTPGVPTITTASMSSIQAYQAVSAFSVNFRVKENNYQIQDLVNWQRGKHSFKIGGEYEQIRMWQVSTRTGGGIIAFSGQQTTQTVGGAVATPRDGVADMLLGLSSSVTARFITYGGAAARTHYIMPYIQDDWRPLNNLTINLGLRWGVFTPYHEDHDRTWNFDPTTGTVLLPDTAKSFAQTALGFTNGLPAHWAYVPRDQVYRKISWKSFDPRIGFALQIKPNLVWRGGYGMYHIPVMGNTPMNGMAYYFDYILTGTTQFPISLSQGVPPGGIAATAAGVGYSPYYLPRTLPDPYSTKYTTNVEYSPTRNSVIGLGYLGASARQFAEIYPMNQAPVPGSSPLASRIPFPNFGQFYSYAQVNHTNYNAGTVRFELQKFNGLLFKSYYTYSKTLGLAQGNEQVLANSYDPDYDYGPVDYDIRHRWTTTFVYRLPTLKSSRVLGAILGQWDLSGIVNLQSGFPFTVTDSGVALNVGTTGGSGQRPNILRNPNLPSGKRTIQQWFDTTAFTHAAPYTWGNERKNPVLGPGQQMLTTAVQRRFLLPLEGSAFTLRLEETNLLNHPNFANPSGLNFSGTNFAQILGTSTQMRQLQASLRFDF